MIRSSRSAVCGASALALMAAGAAGCGAANYRLDEPPLSIQQAPRDVLRLRWRRDLVEREFMDYRPQEWASAAIDLEAGALYVGSSSGKLIAFDISSGRPRWSVRAQAGIGSTPLVDRASATLYFGANDGCLYAVDLRGGRVRWRHTTQGTINRPPVVAHGMLLFTSSEGRIYALDARSGAWRWQYDRESPDGFTIQGYAGVAVRDKLAYTGFSDGMLVALRVATGDVVWTRSLAAGKTQFVDVDSTPVLDGDTLLATSYATGIFALSPETGSVRWQHAVEGASDLVVDASSVYFAAPRAGLVALDRGGRPRWQQAMPRGVPSTPVLLGEYLLLTGTESGLFVARAQDGELVQHFDPGHGISAAPAAVGSTVVALSNQGRLYAFGVVPRARN